MRHYLVRVYEGSPLVEPLISVRGAKVGVYFFGAGYRCWKLDGIFRHFLLDSQ